MRKGLAIAAGVVLAGALILAGLTIRLAPSLKERFVQALRDRFDCDVDLAALKASFFPVFEVVGEGLVLRQRGGETVDPLIAIRRLSIRTNPVAFWRKPAFIRTLRLEGLSIHIPPRAQQSEAASESGKPKRRQTVFPFLIEEIIADGTLLEILPKDADKQPLAFELRQLVLHSAGTGRPMTFQAWLTNPKPPGVILTSGQFGPWRADQPRLTPLVGTYTFKDADLSVFPGIAGILSSDGAFKGVLERIEVSGNTDTPDFSVRLSGKPVHLRTDFSAIVDGTSGNTVLQPVRAQFLRSSILAGGKVTGTRNVQGKTVSLDLTVAEGRLEDLLRLAVKSEDIPLTGAAGFTAKLEIPPGNMEMIDKIKLNGVFGVTRARFSSEDLQKGVSNLSRRGRGKPDSESERVASDFRGHFRLDSGVATFSSFSFSVPGAVVILDGTYDVRSEEMNFRGALRLQAKLSQTTRGIKSFLLKAVDPLFKQEGAGVVLPITITGKRTQPSFRLDVKRFVSRKG